MKKSLLQISIFTLFGAVVLFGLDKSVAYADDLVYTGCLSTGAGVIYNAKEGALPLHSCYTGDSEVGGGGDISAIIAGAGLSEGGSSGSVTLSLSDNGGVGHHTITSDITVTVPSGKAYYYLVSYDGGILYNYYERASGATTFYGGWSARVLANSTVVSTNTPIISTGQRVSWPDLGNNSQWRSPVAASWPIRLTEGTHTLGIDINGYSDNTMSYAHFQYSHLQVLRIF